MEICLQLEISCGGYVENLKQCIFLAVTFRNIQLKRQVNKNL